MQICVSGIGVVSSIGIGVDANVASLASQKDGMGSITLFDSTHNLPVSEVKASNRELVQLIS